MRILTVRNPWAWAIIHSTKTIENRSRNIAGGYRGPVAIHVAMQHDGEAKHDPAMRAAMGEWYLNHDDGHYELEPWRVWHGAIIGVVDLTDVHHAGHCYAESIAHAAHLWRTDRAAFDALPVVNGSGGLLGRADYCSPWAEETGYHMVLANPRPLREPIPFRGALGLRRLDDATIQRIEEQL